MSNFDMAKWQSGDLTSFSETCFASYWDDLPKLIVDGKATTKIDPFKFTHRMALGKYLIENTGGEAVWGPKLLKHWFWGYLAQLDWQRRSGRFEHPSEWGKTNETELVFESDDISEKSWWGFMNIEFSIAVYFGAAEAGLVPKCSLCNKSVEDNLGFQKCVQLWKEFFMTEHKAFIKVYQEKGSRVTFYQKLWSVHTAIISNGVACAKDLEAHLPPEDLNFGLGWCNMVELLAAMNWTLISLESLMKFGNGYLPTLRLAGPETVEWMKENKPFEYTTICNLNKLKDVPTDKMESMCKFWSRVTWWDSVRENMPRTLHALSHEGPFKKAYTLGKILVLAVAPHSLIEAGAWLAVVAVGGALIFKAM